jgi:hypothetical protein
MEIFVGKNLGFKPTTGQFFAFFEFDQKIGNSRFFRKSSFKTRPGAQTKKTRSPKKADPSNKLNLIHFQVSQPLQSIEICPPIKKNYHQFRAIFENSK